MTPLRRAGVLLAVSAVLAGAGCSSYTHKALRVREPLSAGDFEAAAAFLVEEKPGGDGLPYLMELGLVLRQKGEWRESNLAFDAAEQLIDELWTKSISKEVLALATSDETIPYDGEPWERVLVNYYAALNYVDLGLYDDALVECRRINHKLQVYTDSNDDPPTYRSDAFAQYVTALLYEAGGDLDDAAVSLRLADEAYADWEEAYGVAAPESLKRDRLRLAATLGNVEELEQLRERWPDVEAPATGEVLSKGEIVLFWEEGFAPAKIQVESTVPVMKRESDDSQAVLAGNLRHRWNHPVHYEKRELAYLLRLALPAYPPPGIGDRPGSAEVTVVQVPAGADSATAAPPDSAPPSLFMRTELVEDLNAISRRGLEDRMGGILFKTILRALGKYALTKAAEDGKGDVAGKIVNFLTAATEKADTRSWITLPRSIQVGRLLVEPGTYTLELEARGPGGGVRETVTFDGVEVGAGEVRFLNHRTF